MPPSTSLFCEHKRLRSVCPLCGSARAGAATPARGASAHDVDDTIHRLRLVCAGRLRGFLEAVHGGTAPAAAYWGSFDPLPHRGKVLSDEEDPATFRGGLYRGLVKMFDVTIDERRIQGYNGLADWEEMRDYVFRKLSPDALDEALRGKRLLVHGGNGAWPRQQIATELVRREDVQAAVMDLLWGREGIPVMESGEAEVAARLARLEDLDPKSLAFGTKLLHVMAPARWAPLTPRATPEVGEELGVPLPDVAAPADYLRFNAAMLDLMRLKGHPDLARTDMLVADTWDMLQG